MLLLHNPQGFVLSAGCLSFRITQRRGFGQETLTQPSVVARGRTHSFAPTCRVAGRRGKPANVIRRLKLRSPRRGWAQNA